MGSTAASTALLQYEIDTPLCELAAMIGEKNAITCYKLCLKAIYDLQAICNKINPNISFNIKPSLQYASYRKHKDGLHREYNLRKKYGFDVEWLEAKDVANLFGFEAPAALLSAEAGEIDAYRVAHELLRHCVSGGQQVYNNTEIISIEEKEGHVILHTDTGNVVKQVSW
ncbi:MAG: FAD-binding oxidoreductase [Taibaiella sp.]|nr:FAD-binding oxidoreductase [Taibaiella sp.]